MIQVPAWRNAPLLAYRDNRTGWSSARSPLVTYEKAAAIQREANERELERRVGGRAAAGDYLGASQEAMAGGQLGTGVKIQKYQQSRQAGLTKALRDAAMRARSPEEYARSVATYKRHGLDPGQMADWGFAKRLTWEDQKKRDLLEAQIAKAKRGDAGTATSKDYATWMALQRQDALAGTDLADKFWEMKKSGGLKIEMPAVEKGYVKKYGEGRGGGMATRMEGITKQAEAAHGLANEYSKIERLLADPEIYKGVGAPAVAWVQKFAHDVFGADVSGVGEVEAAGKTRDLAVGRIRSFIGDARMSDSDRNFYREIIPSLPDSAVGIALTAQLMRDAADWSMRREQKAFELEIADPDPNVMTSKKWSNLRKWERSNPMFDPERMQQAGILAKARGRKRGKPLAAHIRKMQKKFKLEPIPR